MMKREKNLKFIKSRKGKRGYYITDITIGYRRIRRFAGFTKEEARAFLAKLRIAAREGKLDEIIKPKKLSAETFGVYARALLDSAEWKAKRSASRNEISFQHLTRAFKDVKLSEINPGLVRRYITERTEEGAKPATINREISLLKSILYAAEYDGIIASNPIRGRRVKKLEENNSREKIILAMNFSDDQLQRLINAAAPHLKPILKLAIITGMRKSEILNLRWSDIDFRLGVIRVRPEIAKSKKERYIPICGELINDLLSIERQGEFIFQNLRTGKNIGEIRRAFFSAVKKAGINGLRFHDLRHLAAYRLVKVTDVVTASKILGHSSIQMTMRYVHPTDADKRLAIEKALESLFQGRQKDVNGQISGTLDGVDSKPQVH